MTSPLPLDEGAVRPGRLGWIPVCGYSMWPTLRPGDEAELTWARGPVGAGEIVVARTDQGLVIHRVVGEQGGALRLKGDNCPVQEEHVTPTAVFAVVRRIRRGGRVVERARFDLGPAPLGRAGRALLRGAAALLARRANHAG